MTLPRDSWQFVLRRFRRFKRNRWWIAIAVIQPAVWLLLFGSAFNRIVELPSFTGNSYVSFLAPGIVVLNAVSNAVWGGFPLIEDINSGLMTQLLATPMRRAALNTGAMGYAMLMLVGHSLIVIGLAFALGAAFGNGIAGLAVLILVGCLLAAAITALSDALALFSRNWETFTSAAGLIVLPLVFLSSALIQEGLLPRWIRWIARFNPVNWAAQAGRAAVSDHTNWAFVEIRIVLLAAFMFLCAGLATLGLRSYERSI
jgi:ABC-2 type transport system permease protein